MIVKAIPNEDKQQEKIIAGQTISTDGFPYVVSLGSIEDQPATKEERQSKEEIYKMDRHFCAGALIHEEWVLTAAHCVVDANTKQADPANIIGVGIGSNDLVEMYELGRIPASRIIFPKEYNPNLLYFDLALIQLSIPVNKSVFATKKYSTACLGNVKSSNGQASGPLSSIGWGNTVRFSNHPKTNSWGPIKYPRFLEYIPTKDISGTDGTCTHGRKDLICTFGQNQGTGVCRGDSGGPVVNKDHLVLGMLSHGHPDKDGMYCNGDGEYARVSFGMDWISQNVQQKVCSKDVN